MTVTRRDVLAALATETDADRETTTSVGALASALDADDRAVEGHLRDLDACEFARFDATGDVRVTITGEAFLELDLDAEDVAVVDVETDDEER